MSFRLLPKSVTLNDLKQRNGRYIALFALLNLVNLRCRKRSVEELQESIVFLVRVQCRRKESSRSLSHLLMSFLLPKVPNRETDGQIYRQMQGNNITSFAKVKITIPKEVNECYQV